MEIQGYGYISITLYKIHYKNDSTSAGESMETVEGRVLQQRKTPLIYCPNIKEHLSYQCKNYG